MRDGRYAQGWQQARKLLNTHALAKQQRKMATLPAQVQAVNSHGCYPNPTVSNNWRASLVPAAAVIPAPVAYTNIVAVKTLVVDREWEMLLVRGRKGAVSQPPGPLACSLQPTPHSPNTESIPPHRQPHRTRGCGARRPWASP